MTVLNSRIVPVFLGVITVAVFLKLSAGVPFAGWAPLSVGVWFFYASLAGWDKIGPWEKFGLLCGTLSAYCFVTFLRSDGNFQGWGDVYFFCGPNHEYCNCGFRWNLNGWGKAVALWSFSITSAVGLQKLALQLGLGGLLPGEEVVTKDSFYSVGWRLVPYWLNNWEQNWGTECSSMLFEVPRFAMELLVILPCVQIICSRLKILAAAQIRVVVPERDAGAVRRENVAVNIIKGHWELDPSQRILLNRLHSNLRVMSFITCLLIFAAFNSLWVPLRLEEESLTHPRAEVAMETGSCLEAGKFEWAGKCREMGYWGDFMDYENREMCSEDVEMYVATMRGLYEKDNGCYEADEKFEWALRKHSVELGRMKDEEHRKMIPLIEVTLAMMRFSCEKFFVLLTVYVNYLLFREPPPLARMLVRINSFLSQIFQHVVLYTFPAICWIYGAGVLFSSFVSLIFWGAPLTSFYRHFSQVFMHMVPKGLQPVAKDHIERMGGNCAICWGVLKTKDDAKTDASAVGVALACKHAYHSSCLVRWMEQCLVQNRVPKCPMCQTKLEFQVEWRWPWSSYSVNLPNRWEGREGGQNPDVGNEDFLFGDPNLQGLLEDMQDIPAEVIEDEGHVQRILGREEMEGQNDLLEDTADEDEGLEPREVEPEEEPDGSCQEAECRLGGRGDSWEGGEGGSGECSGGMQEPGLGACCSDLDGEGVEGLELAGGGSSSGVASGPLVGINASRLRHRQGQQ